MPRDFLAAQLAMREQLEEARDAASLDSISGNLLAMKKDLQREIENRIDIERDPAGAADAVRKLMFLERFGEEVDSAYEALES